VESLLELEIAVNIQKSSEEADGDLNEVDIHYRCAQTMHVHVNR
jgi:hypothetical protein